MAAITIFQFEPPAERLNDQPHSVRAGLHAGPSFNKLISR